MQIKSKQNQYTKAGGNPVFVYVLTGTKEELAEYKTLQATNYRENDAKEPLFFTSRPANIGDTVAKTNTNRFTIQRDLEAEVASIETAKNAALGKLQATAEFLGLTKAQMQQMLLGQLSI